MSTDRLVVKSLLGTAALLFLPVFGCSVANDQSAKARVVTILSTVVMDAGRPVERSLLLCRDGYR
jgi:hypothetical protein